MAARVAVPESATDDGVPPAIPSAAALNPGDDRSEGSKETEIWQ
jgi:hypothetical protein